MCVLIFEQLQLALLGHIRSISVGMPVSMLPSTLPGLELTLTGSPDSPS